jgi:sarcosine oxidase subunit beta
MKLPTKANMIVIGGGVMGASIAYHLAKRGVRDIILLEKETYFGQGATGRCAGGVRYQFTTEVNIRLSQASLPMLAGLEEETGQTADYRPCGYLFLLTRESDLDIFRRNVSFQNQLGVPTQWLDGDEIRRMLPMMRLGDVLAGTIHEKDGLADPNSVVMAYVNAAQRLGVETYNDCEVTGILATGSRVQGVDTAAGTIDCDLVINATGPWAGQLGNLAGVEIPISPLRRQMFTTTPLPQIPSDFPFVIDFEQSLYFHREGPGLLIGMSNPDEKPGFDQTVDPEWELVNMEAAAARLPLLEQAGVTSRWAGLYENTPDAHPIFGATPLEGFYICAGFSGHGFMHGPIAGKLMSEIILDGQANTVDLGALDLDRFERGELIQEYNVV